MFIFINKKKKWKLSYSDKVFSEKKNEMIDKSNHKNLCMVDFSLSLFIISKISKNNICCFRNYKKYNPFLLHKIRLYKISHISTYRSKVSADQFLYFLLIIFLFIIIINKTFWGLAYKLNVTSFFYMNIFLIQFIPRVCHMSI